LELLPLTCHAKSTAVNDAVLGGELPTARDGITAAAAPAIPAKSRTKTRNLT
jgi:hypothetical protein